MGSPEMGWGELSHRQVETWCLVVLAAPGTGVGGPKGVHFSSGPSSEVEPKRVGRRLPQGQHSCCHLHHHHQVHTGHPTKSLFLFPPAPGVESPLECSAPAWCLAKSWVPSMVSPHSQQLENHSQSHMKHHFVFLHFYLFMFKAEREKKPEISHPLVHSPNALHSQGRARSKPGVGNPIQISHVGVRDPTT